jgi:tetratricopeptide (TPR) repeat protein
MDMSLRLASSSERALPRIARLVAGIWLLGFIVWGQQSTTSWQESVRRCAEAHDWEAAMSIVDREIARSPNDMDIREWRAKVLMWSGKLADAEIEYHEILTVAPNDPDGWMGLATVYSREGRAQDALRALDRAVALDPKRADLRIARAGALGALGSRQDAKLEFNRALDLDPMNAEGRKGLLSLRDEPRHELRVGVNTDLFNFADANQDEGVSLISHWTSRWSSSVAADGYHWGDTNAEKFVTSLTARLLGQGALTVGGAAAHDNGVIPKDEGFFGYDHGFRLPRAKFVRGLEIVYGQHWYWYTTARILTINEMALLYLPRDWIWSLGLTEARSHFSGTGVDWQPSGMTRLAFPITNWEGRRLGGNLFFAVGTENFAQVDQIGEFSSRTYGGGLRMQLTTRQDVTGFAAYQRRSQDRTESSFGFTYGIRF